MRRTFEQQLGVVSSWVLSGDNLSFTDTFLLPEEHRSPSDHMLRKNLELTPEPSIDDNNVFVRAMKNMQLL